MATQLPCPCWRCGQVIHPDDNWVVGHIVDRAIDPSRTWDPSNHRPEHWACNAKAGARLGNQRRQQREQRRRHPPPRRWI
jgi:5-methylcytosine-specific restriction endonuclease McrA